MFIRIIALILILLFSDQLAAQPCPDDYSCTSKKRTKFKLKTANTVPASIHTDGIYQSIHSPGDTSTATSFLRFFDNGVAFVSCIYCSLRDNNDYNNLSHGRAARYVLINDTLVVESFAAYIRYHYSYYRVTGDRLVLFSYGNRHKLFKKIVPYAGEQHYVFTKAELTSKPGWDTHE